MRDEGAACSALTCGFQLVLGAVLVAHLVRCARQDLQFGFLTVADTRETRRRTSGRNRSPRERPPFPWCSRRGRRLPAGTCRWGGLRASASWVGLARRSKRDGSEAPDRVQRPAREIKVDWMPHTWRQATLRLESLRHGAGHRHGVANAGPAGWAPSERSALRWFPERLPSGGLPSRMVARYLTGSRRYLFRPAGSQGQTRILAGEGCDPWIRAALIRPRALPRSLPILR